MPILPLIITAIPSLVKVAESIFGGGQGSSKKEFVQSILGAIYDKYLGERVPDLPGVNEREVFLNLSSMLIDHVAKKLFPHG